MSKSAVHLLAIDIGAGSGRFVLGRYSDGELSIEELGRFIHRDSKINGVTYWDFPYIWNQVQDGIRLAAARAGHIDAIGIDSFAPDFVCFTESGKLCGNMLSYRNFQDPAKLHPIFERFPAKHFWDQCANSLIPFGLLPQLKYLGESGLLPEGEAVYPLHLANALCYLLSGVMFTDYTQSANSLLNDVHTGGWSDALCAAYVKAPLKMPPLLPCGEVLGEMHMDGMPGGTMVVNVGSHDTAVANHLLTDAADGEICVNAGTWISVGIDHAQPVVNDKVIEAGLNNYGMPGGSSLLCKLAMGMGFIRQIRQAMKDHRGKDYSYADLAALAEASQYRGRFSVYDPELFRDDQPFHVTVQEIMRRMGEAVPESDGDLIRCVYESIVGNTAELCAQMEACTGEKKQKIYLGGGGVQDKWFLKSLAEATGKEIVKMPAESTVIGNMLQQLRALGIRDKIERIVEAG